MKVLLLAGGLGTRLSEETDLRPKPMVEIGGKPILWHIMKTYSQYGFNDFVVLLGYKGYFIKEYFANYFLHQSDVTIDMSNGSLEVLNNSSEPWKVTLLDTGLHSMTGGRIKRAQKFVGDEPFLLTYGDGVADIDITELIRFHKKHGKTLTVSSAQPDGRFGALNIDDKNQEPKVFDYITEGDDTIFEQAPLMNLAKDNEVYTYKHHGFWMPMDTLNDKIKLNELCDNKTAPWVVWNN